MRASTRVAVLLLVRVVLILLPFSIISPAVRLLWIGGYNTSAPDAVAVPRFVLRGSTWFREGLRRSCARLPFGGRFDLTASALLPHCLPVYRFVEFLIVVFGNQYAHFIVVLLGEPVEVHRR